MYKKICLCLILLLSSAYLFANSKDALAPKSSVAEALALPLHTITVGTNDLQQSLLFYVEGLGMKAEGPLTIAPDIVTKQRQLWDIPQHISWQQYRLTRADKPSVSAIRLLVFDQTTPAIHSSWDARELGPFSMGFPNTGQQAQDKHMRKLGFGALNQIEIYQVPRTDGSKYTIYETIFNGPDFVHAVGIERGDGMSPLGEVDANGRGGPAYSAMVVKDSDRFIGFLTEVLGMELRSDRHWKSAGSDGALNVPDGTEFRFSIVYSKGATSGHLLIVDYLNIDAIDNGVAPRLPNRGIGMWTFQVKDLQKVLANASKFGSTIVNTATAITLPAYGKANVATILAPNGYMIEVFETE